MKHQHILDQWGELNAMIEKARTTTEHPEALACMDALKQLADAHSDHVRGMQAEHEAKKAEK